MSKPRLLVCDSSKEESTEDDKSESKDEKKVKKNRSSKINILKDMDLLPFSDEVKQQANCIFSRFNERKTRRSERRKMMVFYCIYNAHAELNIKCDPKAIADAVGMSTKSISKALTLYSEAQTGYKPPQVIHEPCDFIPSYCAQLGIADECIKTILSAARDIIDKEKSLLQGNPQKVAAGILKYWLICNGIQVNEERYSNIVKQSEATIRASVSKIVIIDNR